MIESLARCGGLAPLRYAGHLARPCLGLAHVLEQAMIKKPY